MKNYAKLSQEERALLLSQHKQSRDIPQRDRIRTVLAYDQGSTIQQIANHLLVNHQTVRNYLEDYHTEKRLKNVSGGNYQGKLTEEQTKAVVTHLTGHLYSTVQQIQAYIKKEYGVEYSIAGLTDWLHRQGFTYRKPKIVPAKADTAQQKAFLEEYQGLEKNLPPEESIVFVDSVHPTQATQIRYGWVRKSSPQVVKTTASRTRLNLTGAIDIKTKEVESKSYDRIDSQSVIDFLAGLSEQYKRQRKVHVILDGAGYHRSKEVGKWIESQERIVLHYLPPYSPNLNPIERLWKVMNEYVRNNRYFTSAKEFREAIQDFFDRKILELGEVLASRITSNFQLLEI